MASLFCYFFLIFFVISPISAARSPPSHPQTLLLPVFKDKCTHQYITHLSQRTPLVPLKLTLDLGGRFMWVDCDNYVSSTYKPVPCDSTLCQLSHSHGCSNCDSSPEPKCSTCSHSPHNPIIGLSTSGDVAQDVVSLQSINGKNVSVPGVPFVCGAGFMLENLADGVSGIAALGRGNISIPAYFSSSLGLQKFSVCLSSLTNSSGAIYFGDAPYPSHLITYTPLIRNPVSTAGSYIAGEVSTDYFIGVKTIRVAGREIKFNTTLLPIDNEGRGGTRISTVHPYTLLHTSIYKAVLKAFMKRMKFAFQVVPPIPPFGACYQSSWISNFNSDVPIIDLVLEGQGSIHWRIWGQNSMVNISSFVTCLGFVDGGLEPDSTIIVGGRQLEDNILQFDLASGKLGFSSSLSLYNTSCSNFRAK